MKALRRGWCLGDDAFKDRLLDLWDEMTGSVIKPDSVAGPALKEHGYKEANRLIAELAREHGLPEKPADLAQLRKGDPRKVICAAIVKAHTSVSNRWLAERLHMGHPSAMSQLVNTLRKSAEWPRIAGRSTKRGRKY